MHWLLYFQFPICTQNVNAAKWDLSIQPMESLEIQPANAREDSLGRHVITLISSICFWKMSPIQEILLSNAMGACKNINAEIIGSRDADLYADTVLPDIGDFGCEFRFCRSGTVAKTESCNDINLPDSDKFFLTFGGFAIASISLTVFGENLVGVVEIKS